jgi:D-methionine transport system substrate-binding protein
VAALGTPALAQDAAKKNLLIGATAGSNYDLLQKGILPQLQKKGYQIKLVEFNDYVQPNLALSDGSLDANFFQHRAYFDQFTADRKLALSAIVQGPVAPMGVYSKKHKSLQGIQNGAKVALPNDPSNLARALLVLQQAGLVQVKPGVNPARISSWTWRPTRTSSSSCRWKPPSCRACWKTPTTWWSTATSPSRPA